MQNVAASETVMDFLRTLVKSNIWDYCVIWNLGDDPSRFIEWGECCCSGGNTMEHIKVKEEDGVRNHSTERTCRDTFTKHSIRTQACEALAKLPPVIPLYSGVHGDVVISKQPKWTIKSNNASDSDNVPNGTQVFIPVACGIVELFSTKHVPKEQRIIEFVSSCFEIARKQVDGTGISTLHTNLKIIGEQSGHRVNNYTHKCDDHDHSLLCLTLPYPNNYSSFEGSSTGSGHSNEQQSLELRYDLVKYSNMSFERSSNECVSKRKNCEEHHPPKLLAGELNTKATEKGPFKSKNLVTERNRRKRIKDGMFALRALVPKISKMDRNGTLSDAADYIKELEETSEKLREVLRLEDQGMVNDKSKLLNSIKEKSDNKPFRDSVMSPITEVQVEVIQMGSRDFSIKLINKHRKGGFVALMEAVKSLGLNVRNVNVTTLNGSVLNVLRVEANTEDVEVTSLKHKLTRLI